MNFILFFGAIRKGKNMYTLMIQNREEYFGVSIECRSVEAATRIMSAIAGNANISGIKFTVEEYRHDETEGTSEKEGMMQ